MRWCIVRHDVGLAVVAEVALPIHEAAGWVRDSDWLDCPEKLRALLASPLPEPVEMADAPAEEPPAPVVAVRKTAKRIKEK